MKKIITVLTSVAMLLMGTTANLVAKAEEYSEEYYRLGDVNMDGEVDAVDASAILTYYARISVGENDSNINEALADFDRNGRIDSVDASMVLSLYAKSATMQSVSYELVSIDVNDDSKIIPSKSNCVEFGSVLRFNRKSWALHSRYTENLDADLYEKHQYIHNGDTVVVVGVLGDGWFKISFPENVRKPEQIYIYISDVAFANGVFEKVGENKFLAEYTENLTTTSVAPITTTTTTTTETTTTTSVITNTTAETTSFPYATSIHSIIKSKSDEIDFGSVLMFGKDSWALHSHITENLDDDLYEEKNYIHKGDTLVVIHKYGDGWFRVCFDNEVLNPPHIYVYISDQAIRNETFKKIGENGFLNRYIEESNAYTTTTAHSMTTEQLSTTTQTTTEPVVVLQETLPMIPVAMDPIPSVHDKKMYKFHGESWYIHSKITMDPKGDLYPEKSILLSGESFYVVNSYAGGWYEIYCSSINDTANVFICMSEEDFESFCEYINFKRFE